MVELTQFELKEQTFKGKMDFKTLVNIQHNLKMLYGEKLTLSEIFNEIDTQNYAVILEMVVQSIQRVHPQIKRDYLEDRIELSDIQIVMDYVFELIGNSLPNG